MVLIQDHEHFENKVETQPTLSLNLLFLLKKIQLQLTQTLFFCKQNYLFSSPTFSFFLTMCLDSVFSQITVNKSIISMKHCVEARTPKYGRNKLLSCWEPRHSNGLAKICFYLGTTVAHSEKLVIHCGISAGKSNCTL